MEHKALVDLAAVATVKDKPVAILTRVERIERWAQLLEQEPLAQLNSLPEIEWCPQAERANLRADGSPISVAYADPVLRSAGLAGDRLGDAQDFFELSDLDAHRALCSCLYGRTMQAGEAARRIRALAAPSSLVGGLWALLGLAAAAPVIIHFLR